ncbi:18040_t:CDS:2 [Gigaspora rosea]|nr:18040_t:CDS:2 [Gigaspora rosea]
MALTDHEKGIPSSQYEGTVLLLYKYTPFPASTDLRPSTRVFAAYGSLYLFKIAPKPSTIVAYSTYQQTSSFIQMPIFIMFTFSSLKGDPPDYIHIILPFSFFVLLETTRLPYNTLDLLKLHLTCKHAIAAEVFNSPQITFTQHDFNELW